MRLSIILPAHNEAQSVGQIVSGIRQYYPDSSEVELLLIDDGSSDGTGEAAAEAGARVIRHPYNKGNGAAIKTGIRAARGDVLVMLDADGQHDPADIERLAASIGEYDMVVGARDKGSQQWHRQMANSIYNVFATYLTNFRVRDLTSGFRAIRRKLALQFCYLMPNTFSYPTTLTMALIKAGYNLKYVEIHAAPRVGKSKINLVVDGLRFFVIMAKIAMIFSPLKIFLPLGLLTFLPGALYAVYRLAIGQRWTIPIVISVSVGAVILSMGLLSEQIALLRMQQIDLETDDA